MRLDLLGESQVLIDLRATGLLAAVGHDPTLVARPERFTLDVPEGDGPVDVAVAVHFRVDAIDVPAELGDSDKRKMRDNMRSADVLDQAHFPSIDFRGRFQGSLSSGRVSGEIVIRGSAHPVEFGVEVRSANGGREDRVMATGTWEGRLTSLGLRPYRALLGALRLEDWVRLRVEARFGETPG